LLLGIPSLIAIGGGAYWRPLASSVKRRPDLSLGLFLRFDQTKRGVPMKKLTAGCLVATAVVSGAYAATTMSSAPTESWTVTNYYKQAVYDPKESKIGDIDDVLVDKAGKITGLVIGVGGLLGAGEKDVIVSFTAVKTAKRNDKWWLTLDETEDDLKNAPGFKYDKASTTWVPDKK